jgi:hypothetical protein
VISRSQHETLISFLVAELIIILPVRVTVNT